MEADGQTPCSKKIRSFLGMVLYYLVTEPYLSLLRNVSGVVDDTVQHAFQYTNNDQIVLRSGKDPQNTSTNETSDTGSVVAPGISAVLDAHSNGGLDEVMGASLNLFTITYLLL